MEPFTVQHFEKYASLVVFDDGSRRGLEDWQLQLAEDLFRGFKRNLWIIPEGNGKSTLVALHERPVPVVRRVPADPVAAERRDRHRGVRA
jgi:hypothetical protein